MSDVQVSFAYLEGRRLQLEENVAKLQTSLRNWQAWEIEYEGIMEGIQCLEDGYTQADLVNYIRYADSAS